jgi:hypothetical protein
VFPYTRSAPSNWAAEESFSLPFIFR